MEDKTILRGIMRSITGLVHYKANTREDEAAIAYKMARMNLHRIRVMAVVLLLIELSLLIWSQLYDTAKSFDIDNVVFLAYILVFRALLIFRISSDALQNNRTSLRKLRIINSVFWLQIILALGIVYWLDIFVFQWQALLVFMFFILAMIPIISLKEILVYLIFTNLMIFGRLLFNPINYWTGLHTFIFSVISMLVSLLRYQSFYKYIYKERRLLAENRQLQRMAVTDPLTGLLNRRGFEQLIENTWHSPEGESIEISAVIIDVDNFKAFNDQCGHYQGDCCLYEIALIIRESFQNYTKAIARIGGDEFAVLLNDVTHEELLEVTQEMQQKIGNLKLAETQSQCPPAITVSIGITAPQPISNISWVELYKEADDLLYTAKSKGCNHIVDICTT